MFGIIVNPVSGGGKHRNLAEVVGEIIKQRGESWRLFETQCVGDATNQTQQAIACGCDSLVCIGGDGTLSEVVQAAAGSGKTLYLVPCGTGNDFARVLKLPKDPKEAFIRQLDGEGTAIDCGSVNGRAFINVSGSGFDVEVLRKTEELKSVYPGGTAYRKAVMAVLSSYRAFETEISIDGEAFTHHQATIVEIANGKYFGGGMMFAPAASFRDGLFDVVMVKRVPRGLIPFLLPLFILGIHIYLPVASVVRAKSIVMRAKNMVVNIDGRLEEMDEVRYEMLQGALNVRLPKK